jgi:hypothetical protein
MENFISLLFFKLLPQKIGAVLGVFGHILSWFSNCWLLIYSACNLGPLCLTPNHATLFVPNAPEAAIFAVSKFLYTLVAKTW